MVSYFPVAHLTSSSTKPVSISGRLPWLYVIFAVQDRLIYVGETNDELGLLARVSAHFGPFINSTFKKRAEQRANVVRPRPPFVIVGARLPFGTDPAGFDGTSNKVRKACEAILQRMITERFVLHRSGWVVISETSSSGATGQVTLEAACDSIYKAVDNAMTYMTSLSGASPFHLVLLDPYPFSEDNDESLDEMMHEIEAGTFNWIREQLSRIHGVAWWRNCVPEKSRVECAQRKEYDAAGDDTPPEAFLMLIDLREIIKKNWEVCGPLVEKISGELGKEKATAWLYRLNDIRRVWAHPIRRHFVEIQPQDVDWIRSLREACKVAFRELL